MKLSLSWIFDHIDASYKSVDVYKIVDLFNRSVAEIEHVREVKPKLENLLLGTIINIAPDKIIVQTNGTQKSVFLPKENSSSQFRVNDRVLIKQGTDERWVLATGIDLGGDRDFILPALSLPAGAENQWQTYIEDDYIIDIDNKSITHRPDLWSHRGVAREIAALLNLPFKPLDAVVQKYTILEAPNGNIPATSSPGVRVTINEQQWCTRFACLYMSGVQNISSSLFMTQRLVKISARPINTLVDLTNYVMFDIGQPLHVFDGDKLKGYRLEVRRAKPGESLVLLDGTQVKLTAEDLVIADDAGPCSLAGISGGLNSGVSMNTKNVVLEAAHFDPVVIRRTALRVKMRTEAAARFEKNIDPSLNLIGIRRFLTLMQKFGISAQSANPIVSWGELPAKHVIFVEHQTIQDLLGITVEPDQIITLLEKIEFVVEREGSGYRISVPLFRATKDIRVAQDIVEEVGRLLGYDTITPNNPTRQMNPFSIHEVEVVRAIKRFLAYAGSMHEAHNYALFDESFLRMLNWQPTETLQISNPLSENWRRLVTSLIPHLIKDVYENKDIASALRFFELGRSWHDINNQSVEKKVLAGIIYDQYAEVDFYQSKKIISALFELLAIKVLWKPFEQTENAPWYMPSRSAVIEHDGIVIGFAGLLNRDFISSLLDGHGFIFELDAAFLRTFVLAITRYKPISKYPLVHRDISCFVPRTCTVAECVQAISSSSTKIIDVELIDMFERKEWKDRKSLTVRCTLSDEEKTMTKEEADDIYEHAVSALASLGAEVR